MLDELKTRVKEIHNKLDELRGYLDLAARRREFDELQAQAAAPDFWNDNLKAKEKIDRTNALKATLDPYDHLVKEVEEASILLELAEGEGDTPQQKTVLAEANEKILHLETVYRGFEIQTLLNGKLDMNNAYLILHAGAGGTESCDWAAMLFRMYTRYVESHGFTMNVLDYQPGEEAGIKSVTMLVSGPYAYGYIKAERGVHRLVRISPYDSNKRRHTSFAALDVVAEVDDKIVIEIDEKDLRIDTYRSSGAGGQKVNKTDSAVRIVHNPTGVVVACQAERSQHSNRATCMKMLRAKLYELEMDKKRKEMEKYYGDKGEIAWGHQIRSYVLQPYTMVKDHRTDAETGQVDKVLDGDLDLFIEAYLKQSATSVQTETTNATE
ncbi:MAG: peptide chain release factor 2 [bacterium]